MTTQDPAAFFGSLAFRFDWRKYQRAILERYEVRDPTKRTFHVVAPPGSGKTLVGIEVARRIGRPAVTFSPTTTIQEQWRDKAEMFLPEDPGTEPALRDHVSTDPHHLRALSSLTYQSLATQTQAGEFIDRLGRADWIEELVDSGRSPEGAEAYLRDLEARAPDDARRGVAVRARRRKRDVLASGEAKLEDLLHPNALDLVDRIVAAGTGCLILDEAHHLLDYWAAILAHLIARLPTAIVVGLTATPPASASPDEMENYLALVDGIDFEVPTPAVVRSGHLAPYQDLVLITEPTVAERRFLDEQHRLLEQAAGKVFADPRFPAFVDRRINRPEGTPTWQAFLGEESDVAVAGVRHLIAQNRPLADDVELVPEMRRPPELSDRAGPGPGLVPELPPGLGRTGGSGSAGRPQGGAPHPRAGHDRDRVAVGAVTHRPGPGLLTEQGGWRGQDPQGRVGSHGGRPPGRGPHGLRAVLGAGPAAAGRSARSRVRRGRPGHPGPGRSPGHPPPGPRHGHGSNRPRGDPVRRPVPGGGRGVVRGERPSSRPHPQGRRRRADGDRRDGSGLESPVLRGLRHGPVRTGRHPVPGGNPRPAVGGVGQPDPEHAGRPDHRRHVRQRQPDPGAVHPAGSGESSQGGRQLGRGLRGRRSVRGVGRPRQAGGETPPRVGPGPEATGRQGDRACGRTPVVPADDRSPSVGVGRTGDVDRLRERPVPGAGPSPRASL